MRTCLSIAGFDPTSGAGITADLKVFSACGVYGIGLVSALTAQNTMEVKKVEAVSPSFLKAQFDSLLEDIRPDAAKTGMLFSSEAIKRICIEADRGRIRNLVVDPVIRSSSGRLFLKRDALKLMIDELIPRAFAVTPNIPEAAQLCGFDISRPDDIYRAAEKIYLIGAANVIVKGGHRKGRPIDLLYDGESFQEFDSGRLSGRHHGTGCAFSAALAANIALGKKIVSAVREAKSFTGNAIGKSVAPGCGMNLLRI